MANTISVSVVADVRRLRQGVDTVNSKLGKLGKAARTTGGLLAGAFVGGAALQFGKDVVRAASEAQQSIGATETVYGKYADTVIAKSNAAARAVGLSANDYRELSNTLGSMLSNSGTPMDKLAGKTDRLIRLGADLAATYGGSTADAISAVSSLMRGEADPIEQYGVSIKQSDVNARLAAKGLDHLTGKQLKNAEATARLRLLYEQTKKSQGQFARESNTLAGQQQRLGAIWENLKAKLGTALLPVLTKVAAYMADRLPGALAAVQKQAADLAPAFNAAKAAVGALWPILKTAGGFLLDHKNAIVALVAAWATFKTVNATITKYRATMAALKGIQQTYALATYGAAGAQTSLVDRLTASVGALRGNAAAANLTTAAYVRQKVATVATAAATRVAAVATKAMAVAQRVLNLAMKANPVLLIVSAIAALAAGLVLAYKKSKTFRKIVNGAFNAIRTVAGKVFGWLRDAVSTVIDFVRDHWRDVREILTAPWRAGLAVLRSVLGAIRKAVATVVRAVVRVIRNVWGGIRSIVSNIWGGIRAVTGRLWRAVRDLVVNVVQGVLDVLRTVFGKYREVATRVWGAIRDAAARIWGAIKDAIGRAIDAARSVVANTLDGIKSLMGNAWDAVSSGVSAAWRGITSAVGDAIGNVLDRIRGIKDSVTGFFSGAASWLWNAGQDIIQGLLDGIASMIDSVRDKFSELTDMIPDWKGPRRRDRVLLTPAGVAIMRGLVAGLDKGWGKVKDRLGKATEQIEKSFERATNRQTRATVRRRRRRFRNRNQRIRNRARRLAKRARRRADPGDKRDAYRKRYEKATRRLIDIDKRLDKVRNRIEKRFNRRKRRTLRSLRDERRAVRRTSKAYDRMRARLERAQEKLAEAIKRRRDYMRQIRDNAIAFGDITSLGKLESGEVTPEQLTQDMRNRVNATQHYYQMLRKLKRLGLNDTALQQLYEAGVKGGTAQAEALLEGGSGTIHAINDQQRQLRKAARKLGKFAARDMYQAGVDAAAGLVQGLKRSTRRLRKIARGMARALVRAIKRHLKIKSPSKVFRDEIGANIIAGLRQGVRPQIVADTGGRMARDLVAGFGTPELTSDALARAAAGGNTYTISVTVQPGAAPADVGRQIVAAIRSYERVGGTSWRN